MAKRRVRLREVLFEFRTVGKFVKVSAVDPDSLTEVSIVGDPKRSQKELERVAMQKLEYVLNKRADAQAEKDKNRY